MSSPGNEHFVFIESNTTGTGRIAVERLLRDGRRVTFLARQPEKYPFLAAPADGLTVEVLETNNTEAVAARVGEIHRHGRVDVVLTFSEYYIATVAEVAARYGFRYLDPAVARCCRNKHATREALRAAGLPTPEFRIVASPDEARRASREVTYPCVLKPLTESSSAGVREIRDPAGFLEHFLALHAQRENARGQPMTGEVLVESLLTGPEVSVETVTLAAGDTRVVGVTRKYLSQPPLFVELGHDFPGEFEGDLSARSEQAALDALRAVGYDFGPAHTEVRLPPGGEAVVVEINPRLAGGMIPELVFYATGIDLLAVLLEQLAGHVVDLEPNRQEVAAIRFLTAPRRGRLMAVEGMEEIRCQPLVREVSLNKKIGSEVWPAEEATARLGQVITSGPDRRQVIAAVEQGRDRLRIEVEALSQVAA